MKKVSKEQLIEIITFYCENNFKDGNIKNQLQNYKLLIEYLSSLGLDYQDLDLVDADIYLSKSEKLNNMICVLSSSDLDSEILNNSFIISLMQSYNKNNIINNDEIPYCEENIFYNDNAQSNDPLTIYLKELINPVLSEEEERELLIKYKENNDLEARKKLIEHNLRLVVSIAKRYKSKTSDLLDLIQEGNLGLMKGIDKFNLSFTNRLSTYVSWWIEQAIDRYVKYTSKVIRVPMHIMEDASRVTNFGRLYYNKNGTYPSIQVISEKLNMEEKRVKECLTLPDSISLNSTVKSENSNNELELGDIIADSKYEDNYFIGDIYNEEMINVLNNLPLTNKERIVILYTMGFIDGETHTLEQTSSYLYQIGLSDWKLHRERIRQIKEKAIRKLKNNSLFQQFKPDGATRILTQNGGSIWM